MKKLYTISFLIAAIFYSFFSVSVFAASAVVTATPTPRVVTPTPMVVEINTTGTIHVQEQFENTVYIGGEFNEIQMPDGGVEQRTNLASLDMPSQNITDWAPIVDGPVYAIAVDENTIYIGGGFTHVNGEERLHIASFDRLTGELTTWNPRVEGVVRKITLQPNQVEIDQEVVVAGSNPQTKVVVIDRNDPAIFITPVVVTPQNSTASSSPATPEALMVDEDALGFNIPSLGDILTFVIRMFFVIAGLAALIFMLLGAFAWITSGGDQDSIAAARQKIQAAVVGLLMIAVVLAIVWTLEQVVFARKICLGISCSVTIPALLEDPQ